MSAAAPCSTTRTLVASIAGGPARHYRVQVLPEGESSWRLFATYKNAEVASVCAQRLSAEGMGLPRCLGADLPNCGLTSTTGRSVSQQYLQPAGAASCDSRRNVPTMQADSP